MDRERLAATCLVAALPARVLLDLAHGFGPEAARVGGGLLALAVIGCAVVTLPRWRGSALGRLALAWTALVACGALRADDPVDGLRLALHYVAAPAYGLAAAALLDEAARRRLLELTAGAAAVAVAWSCLDLVAAPDLVLHDYPRWLGGYASHHAHGLAMALFALLGIHLAVEGRRSGALLAAGALVALASTWVRTAWLLVLVAVCASLAARARPRTAAGVAGVAALGACLHPAVRRRFSDVGAVLSLRAPEGGWEAVGSWRGRIWLESFETFAERGPLGWLVGWGLGAHDDLYRALDPHHELLAVLYQLGAVGVAVFAAMLAVALRGALRTARRAEDAGDRRRGAAAVGLLASVALLGLVSNALLERPLVGMAAWGLAGVAGAVSPLRRAGAGGAARAAPRRAA